MVTKLIGFEICSGEFTNEKTGEVVVYSNRNLLCITDVGADDKHIGFSPFEEKKIKRANLALWLHCNDDDTSVDTALKNLVGKPIIIERAPRNGELTVVGIRLDKSSS